MHHPHIKKIVTFQAFSAMELNVILLVHSDTLLGDLSWSYIQGLKSLQLLDA